MEIPSTANCRVKVKELIFDKDNPNEMTDVQMEALRNSMHTYGDLQHIVIDQEMHILDGAHRALILLEDGVEECDAIRITIENDADRRIIRQTMNKLRGRHDPAKDAKEFVEILRSSSEKRLFDVSGIRESDFYKILAEHPVEAQEDIVPGLPEPGKIITQPGDTWQMGEHRLVCGDSTRPETYHSLMQDDKAHIVITDPPYGVDYVAQIEGREGTTGKWKPIKGDELRGKALQEFCAKFLKHIQLCTTADSAYYIFFGMKTFHHLLAAMDEACIYYALPLIWQKTRPTITWAKYHPDYEVLAYGGNGAKGTRFHSQHAQQKMGSGRNAGNYSPDYEPMAFAGNGSKPSQPRWFARYDQTTTWQERPDNSMTYMHPTQKPVTLAERALLNSSREGELVLDCFAGSGFSLIAAHKLKRVWRGIELEPGYCDVIVQRWEHYSSQKAERIPKEAPA